MEQYKICPVCGAKNDISNFLCDVCMADISSVKPFSEKDNFNKKTILEEKSIKLLTKEGEIIIKSGDIVGRGAVGGEILKFFETISRKHAKFIYQDGEWIVEDIGSSNGIYIDGKRVKKSKIKNGQKLSLSQSFETEVLIDED